MIALYVLCLIVVILILQTTLAEFVVELAGAKPDLILLVVLSLGLSRGKRAGIGYGWLLGLIQDVLSGSLLGQNVLSKGIIGYLTGILHRNLSDLTMISHLVIVPLATLFDAAIHLGTVFLLYGAPIGKQVLITVGIIMLLNTIASPLVSWLVRIFARRIWDRQDEVSFGRPR